MAAQNSFYALENAFQNSVFLDRLIGILRAGRTKAANPNTKIAKNSLVGRKDKLVYFN
jgi:hypothetical protein